MGEVARSCRRGAGGGLVGRPLWVSPYQRWATGASNTILSAAELYHASLLLRSSTNREPLHHCLA